MNREICIHAWPCSYFLNSEKRWIPGRLSLTPRCLKFTAEKTGDILVSFQLSSISEIKKEASTFIFSSITILEQGLAKHWFSSLHPNRNVVFNVIEHFWREQLFAPQGAGAEVTSPQSTKGKHLIDMVSDSEKRLGDTARVLHHQGEQFDNIMKGLDKIESQMDVADRMLTELESPAWWPFAGKTKKISSDVKAKHTADSISSKSLGKEGLIVKIPVVFSNKKDTNLHPGSLAVLVSGLEIGDSNSQVVHRYEREEVDDIKVVTPYEVVVRQRFIGKPDIAYRMLSARMYDAVTIMGLQYKKKLEFLEGAQIFAAGNISPEDESGGSFWQTGQLPNLLDKAAGFIDGIVQSGPSPDGAEQAQVQAPIVTEEETQELRQVFGKAPVVTDEQRLVVALAVVTTTFTRIIMDAQRLPNSNNIFITHQMASGKVLRKLKSLALDTETELQRQDEALEVIGTSTERATLSIDKQNHRMRKLL